MLFFFFCIIMSSDPVMEFVNFEYAMLSTYGNCYQWVKATAEHTDSHSDVLLFHSCTSSFFISV